MRIAWLSLFTSILLRHPAKGLMIAWWWITGRRLRAAGRLREAARELPHVYRWWSLLHRSPFESPWPTELSAPHITVHLHLPSDHDPEAARKACQSVLAQSYTEWSLVVTTQTRVESLPFHTGLRVIPDAFSTRSAALRHVLANTSGEYIVPLEPDAQLKKGALHAYARTITDILREGSAAEYPVLYADQDEFDGRSVQASPWLKPEWNRDMFIAQDYLSAACALPRQSGLNSLAHAPSLETVPDDGVVSGLLAHMLLGQCPADALHVSYIATATPATAWRKHPSGRIETIRSLFPDAQIEPGPFGTLIHTPPLPPRAPKVSIIVPTRDRIDLLRPCVESVLRHTGYPDYELLIVDNDSAQPDTFAYFDEARRDSRVRVLHWPHAYNYSAINNFAVAHATGEYICLLNNDTEVISPAWLNAMMTHAVRPEIGAVGARLLYPDRSIQHAGVVIGMGGAAGHAHRGLPEGDPGYFAQALIAREATAVTAACLVVSKDKFDAVGGLDEAGLAIAYNDIDLCLKLRASGLRNFYEPRAVLYHFESKSRGLDFAPDHLARYMRELAVFQKRWNTVGYHDPTHHPQLDPASEIYRLKI